MSTYAAVRKAPLLVPDARPALRRPVRRSAAMRSIPVLDVLHPLEHDAQMAAARAFDASPPTSTSSDRTSPVAVYPHELRRASGVALAPSTRELFEQRMGRCFSGVRVHVGAEAGALAERLHARAFTHGRDVYFARNEFRPETREGRGLIAHELAHTLQPQGGTPMIARFAAPGAAPPVLSAAAQKWLDAWSCVEPTSPRALELLAAFQRLPAAVQAEIVAQFKVNTAATSDRLAKDLEARLAMSKQRVIGTDGRGGTITGTQKYVEDVQWYNQTSRGAAASSSNVIGAAALGLGMMVFHDKERQLAVGEFGAGLGEILLTGPGTNEALGYRGSRVDVDPISQPTIEIRSHVGSGVSPAITRPQQTKPAVPHPAGAVPHPAGPKSGFDDSGMLVRPKPANEPQTKPNAALVKINARLARESQEVLRQSFAAARDLDGVKRIPSATDREIMSLARESHRADAQRLADSAKRGVKLPYTEDSFLNENMTLRTREVMSKRIGERAASELKSGHIGYVDGRSVYGSAKHGVGVVKYGGTWFVVQMKDASAQNPKQATLVEILGKFD